MDLGDHIWAAVPCADSFLMVGGRLMTNYQEHFACPDYNQCMVCHDGWCQGAGVTWTVVEIALDATGDIVSFANHLLFSDEDAVALQQDCTASELAPDVSMEHDPVMARLLTRDHVRVGQHVWFEFIDESDWNDVRSVWIDGIYLGAERKIAMYDTAMPSGYSSSDLHPCAEVSYTVRLDDGSMCQFFAYRIASDEELREIQREDDVISRQIG